MIKCINYNCPIIKDCGQFCTTLYPKSKYNINIKTNFELEKMIPIKRNGSYYCSQFGD